MNGEEMYAAILQKSFWIKLSKFILNAHDVMKETCGKKKKKRDFTCG